MIILKSVNLEYLFLSILFLTTTIDGLAAWFMYKRRLIGLGLAIFATIFKRLEEYLILHFSLDNINLLKDILTQKRLSSGLPVDEHTINQFVNPTTLAVTYGSMLVFSILIVILLLKKRDFFITER